MFKTLDGGNKYLFDRNMIFYCCYFSKCLKISHLAHRYINNVVVVLFDAYTTKIKYYIDLKTNLSLLTFRMKKNLRGLICPYSHTS